MTCYAWEDLATNWFIGRSRDAPRRLIIPIRPTCALNICEILRLQINRVSRARLFATVALKTADMRVDTCVYVNIVASRLPIYRNRFLHRHRDVGDRFNIYLPRYNFPFDCCFKCSSKEIPAKALFDRRLSSCCCQPREYRAASKEQLVITLYCHTPQLSELLQITLSTF